MALWFFGSSIKSHSCTGVVIAGRGLQGRRLAGGIADSPGAHGQVADEQPTERSPLGETFVAADRKHYFVCRRDLAASREMRILRDWLMAETQELRDRCSQAG